MTMKPYTYEAVLMTTQATGTPHAAHLQEANEGLVVHVRESVQGVGDERLEAIEFFFRILFVIFRVHLKVVALDEYGARPPRL